MYICEIFIYFISVDVIFMTGITDAYMKEMLIKAKDYSVVILKKTRKINEPGNENIKYEHGKRNFQLREDGLLSIVCRINDDSHISGLAIFNCNQDEVKNIMDRDPGVMAGIFTYEFHLCSSFSGDKLP